jgi:FkbM family methyltransferase
MDRSIIERTFPRAVRFWFDFKFLKAQPFSKVVKLLPLVRKSKSQLRQDLFVLCENDFKRKGYFVEFGAANGCSLSNTYLLEHKFSWSGILAEPAKIWHDELHANRPKSHIEELCVWSNSGSILEFHETAAPELSTLDLFGSVDRPETKLRIVNRYNVDTISLLDLLRKHNAPTHIDYLSLDTEGSEFEILNSFDFAEYSFGIITCEHNYEKNRSRIHDLLCRNGYVRRYEKLSLFDDWYTKL